MLIGGERAYLIEGCEAGIRGDGRGCLERRPAVIKTDVLLSAIGSCRVKLGGTDVLVGIKVRCMRLGELAISHPYFNS